MPRTLFSPSCASATVEDRRIGFVTVSIIRHVFLAHENRVAQAINDAIKSKRGAEIIDKRAICFVGTGRAIHAGTEVSASVSVTCTGGVVAKSARDVRAAIPFVPGDASVVDLVR